MTRPTRAQELQSNHNALAGGKSGLPAAIGDNPTNLLSDALDKQLVAIDNLSRLIEQIAQTGQLDGSLDEIPEPPVDYDPICRNVQLQQGLIEGCDDPNI